MGKSTACHAAILAPDNVTIHDFPVSIIQHILSSLPPTLTHSINHSFSQSVSTSVSQYLSQYVSQYFSLYVIHSNIPVL